MRVGVLLRGEPQQIEWAARLGFRSCEWIRFAEAGPGLIERDWQGPAEELAHQAKESGVRISAIGALYENPLYPPEQERAARIFRRAIELASHIGVRTVAGFAGAVVETEIHPRGGNPVYQPLENYFPELLRFWEPLADFAADRGVRIAFENCPQGRYHLPVMHYNILGQPAMWERLFNSTRKENLGIEWDASHLMCQFIDPVQNIRKFGSRIFHVHAKDAFINRPLLETYGICHPGVAEHRFPGLGQANWPEIVHELVRAGYDSDLNIEGWHDPVFRDHKSDAAGPLVGKKLEEAGLWIAKRTLENLVGGLSD